MSDVEYVGLILSLLFNVAMVIIACLAEKRARDIGKQVKEYKELEMYADIAFGNKSNNPPWDTDKPDEEYDRWLTRFMSYNGRVSAEIQEDFEFVVDKYLKKPKEDIVRMNELPPKLKRIKEYSKLKVKEIGNILRDD